MDSNRVVGRRGGALREKDKNNEGKTNTLQDFIDKISNWNNKQCHVKSMSNIMSSLLGHKMLFVCFLCLLILRVVLF